MTIRKVLDDKRIYNKREHEGYLRYQYRFRYNEVLGRTEIHRDGGWGKINDYQLNSIHREMENKGAKISLQKLTGLLQSDFVEPFHPFREYFSSLPKWDGSDWIAELAEQVQTADEKYWLHCLRK